MVQEFLLASHRRSSGRERRSPIHVNNGNLTVAEAKWPQGSQTDTSKSHDIEKGQYHVKFVTLVVANVSTRGDSGTVKRFVQYCDLKMEPLPILLNRKN